MTTTRLTARRYLSAAVVGVITIGCTLATAPASHALGGFSISSGTWNVRSSVGGPVVASVRSGQAVSIDCQVVGPAVTVAGFGTSTIYDRLSGIGYVSDLALRETPYAVRDARLPDCSAPPPAAAPPAPVTPPPAPAPVPAPAPAPVPAPAPAPAPAPPVTRAADALAPNESLAAGAERRSADGRYLLVQQSDGNLVLYAPGGRALWANHRSGSGFVTVMQSDGNLVTYAPGGRAAWATSTQSPGARLVVQNDGNVVIYAADGGAVWATKTVQPSAGGPAPAATQRARGRTATSNTAPWGQCTWYVKDRFKRETGSYPGWNGHALSYAVNARAAGWTVTTTPEPRSIVVLQPGVHGANSQYGHVGWVESVQQRGDGTYVTYADMNGGGRPGVLGRRTVKHLSGMRYVLAP